MGASYGRQGIAKRLVRYSLELGKSRGHTVAEATFASRFSQKVGRYCGFDIVIDEISYEEFYGLYHKMREDVKALHKTCVTVVKRL